MNQIQIIASHNSYHLKPDSVIVNFLTALGAFRAHMILQKLITNICHLTCSSITIMCGVWKLIFITILWEANFITAEELSVAGSFCRFSY